MSVLINDPDLASRLLAERSLSGADRYDEVWEGTYMMAPLANDEHQDIQSKLTSIFQVLVGWGNGALVRAGVNVSDREHDWQFNYRCPDVAVFFPGTHARNCDTHWLNGPDLAVEILSPNDRAREKIPFYSTTGVRELLLIDRNPWSLELYHPHNGQLHLTARVTPEDAKPLTFTLLPLTLRFQTAANSRPDILASRTDSSEHWKL